jgi:nitrogen fixation NifU-like protein
MEEYTKEALDHFYNPRNVGEIPDADGVGQVGNMKCGDIMHVYIKVGQNSAGEKNIENVKFKTLGCAAAIAASSMMTELAKGKTVEEAKKMTRDDINKALGILPKQKYHCSILSADALQKAIADYESKR